LQGTSLVKDIAPEPSTRTSPTVSVLGGRVLFAANDLAHGTEPWISDGTPQGTTLVKDITPGPSSSRLGAGVAVGSDLFFGAADTDQGLDLWRTDGTAVGTSLVKDFAPASPAGLSYGVPPVALDGTVLYFGVETSGYVRLWRTEAATGRSRI